MEEETIKIKSLEDLINEEDLKKMIHEILDASYTVDEACERKEKENEMIQDNFNNCYGMYQTLTWHKNHSLRQIERAKIRIYLFKLLAIIINANAVNSVNMSIDKINELKQSIKDQKGLIVKIKESLDRLYKCGSVECNGDLFILMILLNVKIELLFSDFNEYMQESIQELKGIGYIGNKEISEKLEEVDNEINNITLKLGFQND